MKTYKVQEYYNAINDFAPFYLAESWDNAGLLIGSGEKDVKRAVLALDATTAVVEEAKKLGAQLIVTHHPIIFHKIGNVPADSAVYKAIEAGLSVICAHTNLDITTGGVNDALARRLELRDTEALEPTMTTPYRKVVVFVPKEHVDAVYDAMTMEGAGQQGNYAGAAFLAEGEGRFMPLDGASPYRGEVGKLDHVDEVRLELLVDHTDLKKVLVAMRAAHPYEEPSFDVFETHFADHAEGFGRIGRAPRKFTPDELAAYVKERLGVAGLKYVAGKKKIDRIAVCGGAGSQYVRKAMNMGAQALVTSDADHDEMLEAVALGMTLIDAGHYATEAVVLPVLYDKLIASMPEADIVRAKTCADPARYLIG